MTAKVTQDIERVARAIAAARGFEPDRVYPDNRFADLRDAEMAVAVPAWRWFVKSAIAAMEELMTPSPKMVRAGCAWVRQINASEREILDRMPGPTKAKFKMLNRWRAMLSHALGKG